LADEITYTHSPQAIQAYGFVVSQVAYAFALEGTNETAGYQATPEFSIVPRLPDGVWLQNSQMQIDTSGASTVTLTATGGDSLLAVVGGGTATLTGGTGTCDLLYGGSGPTTLKAGTGNDYLFGGSGSTTFVDNTGNNYMHGGTGANTYLFAANNSGHDTIANFNISTDHVQIAPNLDSNGITTAAQLITGATVSNGNTILHLSSKDDITLLGISQPSSLLGSILVA
jgi:Ca2+-binding RTX toxin-like protein